MTPPGYRFAFAYTTEELAEARRFARGQLNRLSHGRVLRFAMLAALIPLAGLFGFVWAPIEIDRPSFDSEMSIAVFCFMAACLGVLGQALVSRLAFRGIARPFRSYTAGDRTLMLDATGVQENAGGRRFGLDWAAGPAMHRGRTILLFLSPGAEFMALPLRLLPDGGAALEREIASWLAPPSPPPLEGGGRGEG